MSNPLLLDSTPQFFKNETAPKVDFVPPPVTGAIVKEPDVPMIIHGIQAMSTYEWHVAQALDTLELSYDYQKAIGYGRGRRGGQVLDFVVYAAQTWIIDVRGAYWHRGDDLDFERAVKQYYKTARVLIMEDQHCQSKETALTFLRQNGLG